MNPKCVYRVINFQVAVSLLSKRFVSWSKNALFLSYLIQNVLSKLKTYALCIDKFQPSLDPRQGSLQDGLEGSYESFLTF